MLMKWEDLEKGDVVKFTNEFLKYYKSRYPFLCDEICDKEFIVFNVEIV